VRTLITWRATQKEAWCTISGQDVTYRHPGLFLNYIKIYIILFLLSIPENNLLYKYYVSGHYPPSCFSYVGTIRREFRLSADDFRLDSSPVQGLIVAEFF
jgi:hypothetical protein